VGAKRNLKLDVTARFLALQELWKAANYGVFQEVAAQLNVSHQFVGMVYRGDRRSKRVEAALLKRGAPVATARKKQSTEAA
jgi:hypothetical protein